MQIIIELLLNLINQSGGIYNETHLKRKDKLIAIINQIPETNSNFINGLINQAKFILRKKELFFLLRKYINKDSDFKKIDPSIKCLLHKKMRKIAGKEKNQFKKTKDDYKIFLSEIDILTVNYLESLWIEKNLIKAIKTLEGIFVYIRKNMNVVKSVRFSEYFISEYLFLSNFIKLILLSQDFESFSSKTNLDWQKELSKKVSEQLLSATQLFKYPINHAIQRKLLITGKSTSGKFLEFIIFYLLKRIFVKITTESALSNKISSNDKQINELLGSIKKIKNSEEITWSKKIDNTDIDILLDKDAIFIKTGIISSADKKRIRNELRVAKDNGYKSHVMIDIGKNLLVAREIYKYTTLIDIGAFLQEIYRISKEIGVSIELTVSDIKSFGGFTGG